VRISLDHVHIFCSNASTTIAFFTEMFGANVVWDEEAAGSRNVRLALGRAFIHLYDQPAKNERGGAVHHLGIETDDLDGLVKRMKANGFQFRNPVREEPRFRYVMIAAPDNLLIELFQCRDPGTWQIAP
jgi:catechol 2,3-dioxygenase-like lactoylglutathione lyase family enzyme